MDILIVGAGISGCSAARALKDRGHDVSIIEKEDNIGGLCKTQLYQGRIKYEPFGARVFHTDDKEVEHFVKIFSKFNDYVHRKGMIIEDKLIPFPITLEGITKLSQKEEILSELGMRPEVPDYSNFVDCMKSIFGETLYRLFIENYSKKMWEIPLELLPVSMGIKRVEFSNEQDNRLFGFEWQGVPVEGYTSFLEKMIEGIEIKLNNSNFDKNIHDMVLYSGPIDSLFDHYCGELKYRGLRFDYFIDEKWENVSYGTINLPDHPYYIRKANFNVIHQQESELGLVQYQEPISGPKMYPLGTEPENSKFNQYLKKCCETNIIPIGRLGCYKYLDMDESIKFSLRISKIVENYLELGFDSRFNLMRDIINNSN